ncbi:class I ribonucleotide reductase maintenance protein YfaE [Shewanella maritima]|uniref:class I ribonucleotide reductase maintenance protein YfaE n=1 Tax=Shewanella maritima TaxID=2520507 RepID=UPI003735D0A0
MSLLILTYNPYKKAPIVSIKGQPVLLFNNKQSTLLEALEFKKLEVFSECRNGFCGACKTKINSGEVTYVTEPLVELADNECLPCCCVPETNIDLDMSHTPSPTLNLFDAIDKVKEPV